MKLTQDQGRETSILYESALDIIFQLKGGASGMMASEQVKNAIAKLLQGISVIQLD
jgi:hypothetical protein